MPNYDFRCPVHGFFEGMSFADSEGVIPVRHSCGELSHVVWLRAPAMKPSGVLVLAQSGITAEERERLLQKPEPEADYFDSEAFDRKVDDTIDKNTGKWHAMELEPVAPMDEKQRALVEPALRKQA
jgi:hypothetical protein